VVFLTGGQSSTKKKSFTITSYHYFFLPLPLPFEPLDAEAGLEAADITLEALEEGAADVALLPASDLILAIALFYPTDQHLVIKNEQSFTIP
jgi:hypothetical protein